MKKLLPALFLIIILFSSCQSSVRVSYMVPSEIDMGRYRNIALASTVPYDGFMRPSRYIRTRDFLSLSYYGYAYVNSSYSYALKDDVARYATSKIYETLAASGYFNILGPETTDQILNLGLVGVSTKEALLARGIDAVIIPRIDNMSVDEYIYARDRIEKRKDSYGREYETEVTYFYYDADYYLKLSYSIVDVRTEKVIATRSFTMQDNDDFRITPTYLDNYPYRSFRNMIDSTMRRITRQLVPLQTYTNVTLMDNKPKSVNAEAAYKEASNGNMRYASRLFLNVYETEGHVPSGFNAALTLAGSGDIPGAIEIAERVYNESGNHDVYVLLSRLNEFEISNEESIRQMSGEGSSNPIIDTQSNTSIYDALRR